MSDIRATAPYQWPEVERLTLHSHHLEDDLRISLAHRPGNTANSLSPCPDSSASPTSLRQKPHDGGQPEAPIDLRLEFRDERLRDVVAIK